MKLNHDCMRDCLLYLESVNNIHISIDMDELDISLAPIFIETMFDDMTSWTNHDILYALFNLEQGVFINASKQDSDNGNNIFCVNYITLQGHELLDSIRDDDRWKGIKKGLDAIRNYSLSAINAIADGMMTGAISAYLSQKTGA